MRNMTYVAACGDEVCNVGHIAEPGQAVRKVALPSEFAGHALHAGTVSEETRATIPLAVQIVRRISPWVTVITAPRVLRPLHDTDVGRAFYIAPTGAMWVGVGGMADLENGIVFLATTHSPDDLLTIAAHEAFHALETRMGGDLIDMIDQQLSAATYGDSLGGYWARPIERRARAFAAWAMRIIEGMPAPSYRLERDGYSLDEIFAAAWSGGLGHRFNQGGGREAA